MTPADPTPTAAVAPTGGETDGAWVYEHGSSSVLVALARLVHPDNGYCNRCGGHWLYEANGFLDYSKGEHRPACPAHLLAGWEQCGDHTIRRAALSSPVRAEPRQGPFMCDLHSPPLIFETADDAVRHFEATKHNYTLAPVRAERGEAERIATLEMALREIASAADGRALMIEDFLAHTKLRSAVFRGTASAMRSWSSLARAALTPTPPATPTEPTDA